VTDPGRKPQTTPPGKYRQFAEQHPQIIAAYEQLGSVTHQGGPLDAPTRELIKLAFAIGAGLESAAHAHARLAREVGASDEDVRHVPLLATTTLGFPSMMRARSWVEDVLEPD
jgi:AhpD family alkylhydroperoxidase